MKSSNLSIRAKAKVDQQGGHIWVDCVILAFTCHGDKAVCVVTDREHKDQYGKLISNPLESFKFDDKHVAQVDVNN